MNTKPTIQSEETTNAEMTPTVGTRSVEMMKDKKERRVDIRYQQRNGRKGITTVSGLPSRVRFKKLVKAMKKEWSTGATILKDEEYGTLIQLQGDLRRLVGPFLVKINMVEDASQIRIHGH